MAFKLRNPEKVVSCCPVGIRKSRCPSIQRTRRLRKEILRLSKLPGAPPDKLDTLRKRLVEKKKAGITGDCPTCPYNQAQARSAGPAAAA